MKQKPKVAVIGLKGLPAFGGAAAVGESLICELKDEFDFTALSTESHTSKENTNVNGVKQIVFQNYGTGSLNTFCYFLRCLVHVLFNKYDLVHLHHAASGFITPFLRLRYKVVVTFHGVCSGIDDPKFTFFHNRFFEISQRLNIRWANIVVSVSKPNKEYLDSKHNRDIVYIPNAMNILTNHTFLEKVEDNQKYICFSAARIYQIKGLHLLLKAAHKITEPIKLVIIGDLNQVEKYKTEIISLSTGLNIEFTGMIMNK